MMTSSIPPSMIVISLFNSPLMMNLDLNPKPAPTYGDTLKSRYSDDDDKKSYTPDVDIINSHTTDCDTLSIHQPLTVTPFNHTL